MCREPGFWDQSEVLWLSRGNAGKGIPAGSRRPVCTPGGKQVSLAPGALPLAFQCPPTPRFENIHSHQPELMTAKQLGGNRKEVSWGADKEPVGL